jgi:hypothetical protein
LLLVAPPAKFQKKLNGVSSSGSVPVAVKFTEPPAPIAMLLIGVSITPLGARLATTVNAVSLLAEVQGWYPPAGTGRTWQKPIKTTSLSPGTGSFQVKTMVWDPPSPRLLQAQ